MKSNSTFNGKLTDNGIVLRRASFANQLARVEASGELRDRAADFNVAVTLNDLAPVADTAGVPLHGQASVRLRIRSEDIRRTVTASADAILSDPLTPQSPLQELVGSQVSITGNFVFDADGRWAVRDLKVTGDAAELEANLTKRGDALALDGEYQLTLPRLSALVRYRENAPCREAHRQWQNRWAPGRPEADRAPARASIVGGRSPGRQPGGACIRRAAQPRSQRPLRSRHRPPPRRKSELGQPILRRL